MSEKKISTINEMKNMISIIVPCYNAEKYIKDIVSDVLKQTYTDWELILVSNGKKQEKQLAIANSVSVSDERIKVYHTDLAGVSNARNIGINKAKGDWICFVDADDKLNPRHLEIFAKETALGVDFIEGGFTQIDINGKRSIHKIKRKMFDLDKCLGTSKYIECSDSLGNAPWHALFRTDFLRRNHMKFDVRFSMNEDRIFKQKVFLCARRMLFIPMTGYVYLASAGSAMSRWHATIEESWKVFLDLKDEIKRKSGIAESLISAQRVQMQYYLVWQYVWNMFKSGCPLSFFQKYMKIREYMSNSEFQRSCRLHDWSKDKLYYRLYHLCIQIHSPFGVSLLFLFQHKIKQLLNRVC